MRVKNDIAISTFLLLAFSINCKAQDTAEFKIKELEKWKFGLGIEVKGNLCPWQRYEIKPQISLTKKHFFLSLGPVISNKMQITSSIIRQRPGLTVSGAYIDVNFILFKRNISAFSVGLINDFTSYKWTGYDASEEHNNTCKIYKFSIMPGYTLILKSKTFVVISVGCGLANRWTEIITKNNNIKLSYSSSYLNACVNICLNRFF